LEIAIFYHNIIKKTNKDSEGGLADFSSALSFKQLKYFVATAELGQISRAATALSISQSAITTAIQELEKTLGAELFRRSVVDAATPDGAGLPVLLEIDSDREASSDRAVRTRREHFYRRLGCVKVAGLRYLMPLRGVGPVPEMDLMVYQAPPPVGVARGELKRWLQAIYRDVYRCSPDDPRIVQMLRTLPDPVSVE